MGVGERGGGLRGWGWGGLSVLHAGQFDFFGKAVLSVKQMEVM